LGRHDSHLIRFRKFGFAIQRYLLDFIHAEVEQDVAKIPHPQMVALHYRKLIDSCLTSSNIGDREKWIVVIPSAFLIVQ